jgi:hypothetical protein
MLAYQILDEAGNEVRKGDLIKDFRGDSAIFLKVSRGTEYNGTAIVTVSRCNADGEAEGTADCYAQVFGLKVQTKCGVPACGSVSHSTRDHNTEQRH